MPSRSSRSAAAAVALAVAALVLSVLPAAACEPSLANCRLNHDQTEATLADTRQIVATVPLRADNEGLSWSLYRSLLSPRYDMPLFPQVAVALRQFSVPSGEAPQTTWIEGTVALRATSEGQDGWYPISSATTSAESFEAGRAMGLPRYTATGTFSATEAGWQAQTTVGEQSSMLLEWASQPDVAVSGTTVDLAAQRQPYFAVAPVFQGPNRTRQQVYTKPPVPVFDVTGEPPVNEAKIAGVTALAPTQKGMVHLSLNPDLNSLDAASAAPLPDLPFAEGQSLADLIVVDQTVPGLFWQTDALLITQTDDLDDGRDGDIPTLPTLPPVDATVVAPPAAVTVGFLPPRLVLPQGSTLNLRNEDQDTHDLTCEQRDPVTRQPLCRSAYANTGETKPVTGVQTLPAGDHLLRCSLHSQMEFTLTLQ